MISNKYDEIRENEFGRRYTIRYKQYEYDEPLDGTNWIIKKMGVLFVLLLQYCLV